MPIVVESTDYLFDEVLVWDMLGGAIRPLRGGVASVSDPVTGDPLPVSQGGQVSSRVVTDGDGRVTFTAAQNAATLTGHGFSFTVSSSVTA